MKWQAEPHLYNLVSAVFSHKFFLLLLLFHYVLIQEQLPDLWSHFQELNLEAHMYASQWFLTLFTAKFPLCMVFHITDLLLCEVKCDSLHYIIWGLLEEFGPHCLGRMATVNIGERRQSKGWKEKDGQISTFSFLY